MTDQPPSPDTAPRTAPDTDVEGGRARVDVPGLLARLRADDPGRPRVTWYGADGERVELSARVLENWVAKTANLLVEELDAEVGTPVLLVLPVHWRAVVWALALAATGADVRRSTDGADGADGAEVVVVDAEGVADGAAAAARAAPHARLVVVALPALVLSAGPLPPGALDHNAEVAGYGDDLPRVAGAPGLAVAPGAPSARVLVDAASPTALDDALAALAAGGSVVLLGAGAPDAAHLARVEGAEPLP